jgi:hypothetical protein
MDGRTSDSPGELPSSTGDERDAGTLGFRKWFTKNGVKPVEECSLLLIANSTSESNELHSRGYC